MPRLPGALGGALGWVLFAAIIVTLVNWFVVLPIKGAPMGGGFRMPGLVVVPIVYGFWGLRHVADRPRDAHRAELALKEEA